MTMVDTQKLVADFANQSGVRKDWHEPDEQGVTAVVEGYHLDNAMGNTGNCRELVVKLSINGKECCVVNLANLLAIAACTYGPTAVPDPLFMDDDIPF